MFTTRGQWRSWLEKNHRKAAEAWLLHAKKGGGGKMITLAEGVEEALCFGWIDSRLQPQDETCFILRYSPRRPDSVWSITNVRRIEKLARAGRLTPAGLATVEVARANGQWAAAIQRERVDEIPADLEEALRKFPNGVAGYHALTDSRKKQLLYWLSSAKRPPTRQKRITAIVAESIKDDPGTNG